MKFILGGRMGDLIHQLYVVANTPGKHDLLITDRRDLHSDGFILPLAETIKELEPIMSIQSYVNEIRPYENEDAINLNLWRRYAYTASWTNLLSSTFDVPINPVSWIKMPYSMGFQGCTLVHKSLVRMGDYSGFDLNDTIFIGTKQERDAFNNCKFAYYPSSLLGYFTAIASCKMFIGNQSLPLAIAHSLDVPRIGLLNEVDKAAYIGEELIWKNFSYVL